MMVAASLFLIFSARAVILLLSDIKFCWIWKLLYIKMPNTAWCEWSLWFPRCKIFKLQTSHLVHISYFFPPTSLFCSPLLIISLSSLDASVCLSLQWYVLLSHLLSPVTHVSSFNSYSTALCEHICFPLSLWQQRPKPHPGTSLVLFLSTSWAFLMFFLHPQPGFFPTQKKFTALTFRKWRENSPLNRSISHIHLALLAFFRYYSFSSL